MFTGIVEELGEVVEITGDGQWSPAGTHRPDETAARIAVRG